MSLINELVIDPIFIEIYQREVRDAITTLRPLSVEDLDRLARKNIREGSNVSLIESGEATKNEEEIKILSNEIKEGTRSKEDLIMITAETIALVKAYNEYRDQLAGGKRRKRKSKRLSKRRSKKRSKKSRHYKRR